MPAAAGGGGGTAGSRCGWKTRAAAGRTGPRCGDRRRAAASAGSAGWSPPRRGWPHARALDIDIEKARALPAEQLVRADDRRRHTAGSFAGAAAASGGKAAPCRGSARPAPARTCSCGALLWKLSAAGRNTRPAPRPRSPGSPGTSARIPARYRPLYAPRSTSVSPGPRRRIEA